MWGFGHLALRETFNKRLTLAVLLIMFSQFNFGFDQQGFAASQAMDPFAKQFGKWDPEKEEWYLPSVWLSWFNGLNYLGQAAGVIIGSYISKRWGRRMCMFTMSLWALVCATIVITSKTSDQILVSRVLNYIYIGMELAVVPIFQAEMVPPASRGFIVATYQISLMTGGLVVNCIARGTSSLSSNAAWQIPLGLFYLVPSVVAALIWLIPESPRWLVLKDRPEDAMRVLHQLRDGKFSDEDIQAEFAMILHNIQAVQEQGTFLDIFRSRHRRRTGIVVGSNFFLQATGQLFTSLYGAIYVKSLGTVNPFNITVTIALVNVATAFLAMTLFDRVGRRRMILAGCVVQIAALMTMGGLGTAPNPDRAIKAGIVATMVIFNFGYSLGWAPGAHVLSAEIPNNRARDMTYRTASVLNISVQCAVATSMPYLLNAPYANLGSKVGFIFGSVAVLSLVFAFFVVPDCAGRTLEEIDWLFDNHIATRKFRSTKIDLQAEERADLELKEAKAEYIEVRESGK